MMSQLFPLLDKRHVFRLLRGAVSADEQDSGLHYTAEKLSALNIINLRTLRFIRCAHPADEDYPDELNDLDCEGLVYLDDPASAVSAAVNTYRCMACGRVIEFPNIRKEIFSTTQIARCEAGIVNYLQEVFSSIVSVERVISSNPQTLQIELNSGRTLYVCIQSGYAGEEAVRPDNPCEISVVTHPFPHRSSRDSKMAQTLWLADILTKERRWFTRRIHEIVGAVPQRHPDGDLLLHRALLDAYPTHAALNQMVRLHLNKNLDALALGDSLDEVLFKLIQRANSEGWRSELMHAAQAANPTNAILNALILNQGR